MKKMYCLLLALLVTSCSMELDQPPMAVDTPAASSSAIPSTALLPATQVPVTWAHLDLTGELIYLSSTRENDVMSSNVQMLDLVSGNLTTIFSMPRGWVYYAAVSIDAETIVMSYTPPPQAGSPSNRILYHMPMDGSAPPQPLLTPPTPDDRYLQAEWSPDGKYLYIVHYNINNRVEGQLDPVYDIFRIRYPDGHAEPIAEHAFWPRISSNSTRIVYITVDPVSAKNELVVANADGSDPQKIMLSNFALQDILDAPIFSPDGMSILFRAPSQAPASQQNWFERMMGIQVARAHDVPSDWWSVPVNGGEPTQLTNIQTINLFGSISPDNQRIASLSGEGLFVMNLDGSNLSQLIVDPQVHGTVSWIP